MSAAGLPVVSTPLPEVALYKQMVNLADTPDEFVRGIAAGLNGQAATHRATRAASMSHETWSAKLAEVTNNLKAHTVASRMPPH